MKFTYETQGAITYLVCELDAAEQLDTLTLGMLTNNHIAGLAPVLYTEMNGQRYLKYNISAKVSAGQFFGGNMNKQRTLLAFYNILSAICSADEYMIDPNCFVVAPEYLYLNVSSCETALVCVPAITEKDINQEAVAFFKKIVFSTQFDDSEDVSYVTQMIAYMNSSEFNVYGMRDLVDRLRSENIPAPAPVAPSAQPVQTHPATPPVPSFDSTITMEDMMAKTAQPVNQIPVQPPVPKQNVNVAPAYNAAQKPAPVAVKTNNMNVPVPQGNPRMQNTTPPVARPITQNVPAGNVVVSQAAMGNHQPVMKVPTQNKPGFAIPGQAVPTPQNAPVPGAQASKQTAAPNGEKKMSLFGLLANYNKENAELYKKQKAEAKAKKSNAVKAVPATPIPVNQPAAGVQQNPAMRPPQPSVPVQTPYRPTVQPVPVQNSFNETTVLSPVMAGGETTVLSAEPSAPNPCLTRIKTGERVSINKPVFRIGKEKSYVDYFIADNTAISRSHANIHTENGEYFIEDTNSTNHTYINGVLINSNVKTKLSSGDKVRLANEDFTFSV